MLLPEIALTPQLEKTFNLHFSSNELGIIHSKIPTSKKLRIFYQFRRAEINIIIGTRSALFAPAKNLKLLIIDEEHESTYKNSSTPRYHVRQIAQVVCQRDGAVLLFGSATPSIESYYQAKLGNLALLKMKQRYFDTILPSSKIVPPARNLKQILSDEIYKRLEYLSAHKKQAILYINRRGYSSAVQCLDCRFIQTCPRCSVSLHYHKNRHHLICHYCGFKAPLDQACGACGSPRYSFMGMGIEKIEEELKRKCPELRLERMDSDTSSNLSQLKDTLNKFNEGKTDVLIGTQMLTKGHDFPHVTDVYIIYPELGLSIPDFRANERTFSQITQVSGRAGRRKEQGIVLIQTDFPQQAAIEAGKAQDYQTFLALELKNRKDFGYPPYSKVCRFVFRGHLLNKSHPRSQAGVCFFGSSLKGFG